MANIAEIHEELSQCISERTHWDDLRERVAKYFAPNARKQEKDIVGVLSRQLINKPASMDATRRSYSGIGVRNMRLLTARIYELTMRPDTLWHDLSTDGTPYINGVPRVEERQFLDIVRKQLFKQRYNQKSNFKTASYGAVSDCSNFGTGAYLVEDALNIADPYLRMQCVIYYTHVPVNDLYLGRNALGHYDKFHRRIRMTLRQIVQKFGEGALSEKQKAQTQRKGGLDEYTTVWHTVRPRRDKSPDAPPGSWMSMNYESVYWCPKEKRAYKEHGYRSFPLVVYSMQLQDGPYGYSYAMDALADMSGLNMLKHEAMIGVQMATRPPMASADDSPRRLMLNPGANNPGLLDGQGGLKVKPILNQTSTQETVALMQQEEKVINDLTLYTFFQELEATKTGQMDALTLAAQQMRASQVLAPFGDAFGMGNAVLIDRELTILFARGFTDVLVEKYGVKIPPSLEGKEVEFVSSSTLDAMRKMQDVMSIKQTFDLIVATVGQIDPDAAREKLDVDAAIDHILYSGGMPPAIARTQEQVDKMREQRAKLQQAQAGVQMAQQAAGALKDTAQAAQSAQDAGLPIPQLRQGP